MRFDIRAVGGAIVVLGSVALSTLPVLTPSGDVGISIERAVDHVEFIAQEPHPMGTPEVARVREYLVATLLESGLTPETQMVDAPDYFGAPGKTVEITNVMTRIAGTARNEAVLLMAHYDTVPTTPGANDNAAAVAVLLETGRALIDDPPPNDVILLFTDGEEPTPRFGASAFTTHPWFDDVLLAVNFEGIGVAGSSLLVELSGPAPALVSRLAAATPHPATFSFLTRTAELIGGASTDFDVIRDAGVPGYNFAYMRGSSIYHTERDVPSSLNVDGMAHQTTLALGIARDFGPLEVASTDGEAVFFTIPGWVVVRYGDGVAFGSAVLAAVVLGWVLLDRVRRGRSSLRRLGTGTGLALVGVLAAVLAMTTMWIGIVSLRGEMGMVEGYTWLLVLGAGLSGSWFLIWRRSRQSGSDVAGGIAVVWGLLSLLTGLWLPSMSYLFVWPAIAAGVVFVAGPLAKSAIAKPIALAIITLPTAVVLTPAVDTFFQLATPRPGNPDSELPATIAVPLLILILALGLVQSTTSDH
ncbi:MAG: M28 family peptidase [Actinomycetota bacterium]|nr:M28 family peptidase [Actinomycetota bacterium]